MSYKIYLDLTDKTPVKWWYNLIKVFQQQNECISFETFLKPFDVAYHVNFNVVWSRYLEFRTEEDAVIFILRFS